MGRLKHKNRKANRYINGTHSGIEVSKEEEWDARRIYERGMKLLHFMEERWDIRFANKEQMEELLHIAFVNDGRTILDDIPEVVVSVE